jgi:glycosyltransferase involved in cell wall biosynthesis
MTAYRWDGGSWSMRINFFTLGDCTNVNTWSGLPYYFYHSLLNRSINVRPIDLDPSGSAFYKALRRLTALSDRVVGSTGPGNFEDVVRSRRYRLAVNRRVRTAAQLHRDVDLNLFLTFSFSSASYAPVPVVHFCDRTYEQHLQETGRTPTSRDRTFIDFDRRNIERAELVLTTGELCADFIRKRYRAKHLFCLRAGNSTNIDMPDPDRLIDEKAASTNILCIGKGAYKRGADILLRAFTMFNERFENRFTLHFVGIRKDELPELQTADSRVVFHGYLDRAVPADLQRYNDLVRTARLFVMPMRPGPFPGVVREVQLQCTPVIMSDVSGGSEILTAGHDAVLVDSLEPEAFAAEMSRLVQDDVLWRQLARNGHFARRNSSWSSTADTFLDILRRCNLIGHRH